MSFAAALAATKSRRGDLDALAELAEQALAEGEEEAALAVIVPALRSHDNGRLWQWTGLLHRSLDEQEKALEAFGHAVRLAPDDASIAHGFARVTLEAGLDARALFDRALKLGPSADVILGQTAARFAMGDGPAAADQLATILDRNPLWTQGHIHWAQLQSMNGHADWAMATVDKALTGHRGEPSLWQAAIQILTSAGRHAEAADRAEAAIAATGASPGLALSHAAALSEAGRLGTAAEPFEALGEPANIDHATHLARYLIRVRAWDRLAPLVDRWMQGDTAHLFWPYASIAWRKADDPRARWLEGDERLVRIYDLGARLPSLEALADRLRTLHQRSGRFLDQSVRGGTQTDGPLLKRIDPEIRALRAAIVEAVSDYRATLPAADPTHPMLSRRRDGRVRFAGSWSVRLNSAGFHSNHVHPEGWISSAFYVAVPDTLTGTEGWLALGEPQAELGLDMPAVRHVEPKPGRLVLFPSMMWHGTVPFESGERMTVAFDVAPPR